jgi:hypothetical protein
MRCDSLNDAWQLGIKFFVPTGVPIRPVWAKQGGYHENDFLDRADHSFRAMTILSCFGLAVSFCLMAFGMDLNSVWL